MYGSRLTFPALLGLLIALVVPAVAGAAAIDPERNLAQPVPSLWTSERSEAGIKELIAKGWRLTDISVERQDPVRFAGVFVANSGPYARNWGWWFGKSSAEVNALTGNVGYRLIDVEPYTVDGQRRFAIVDVANEGEAAKEWGWNYDLTVPQITAEAERFDFRVVDLDAYVVDGRRLYSYVGIKNQGVDARGWWLYENVTQKFVDQKLAENGARPVDVESLSRSSLGPTRVSVVMVDNPEGTFTLPFVEATLPWLEERRASNGVRVAELEPHGDRWTGVLIDNIDGEDARMRSVVRETVFKAGYFGVFAKRVGGPTYVGLADQDGYNPASVLKLVPLLYVMDLVDRGKVDLDRTISWRTPYGSPEQVLCERPPRLGKGELHSYSLRETLRRSLGESLNPAHEALLQTFGRETIVNWARAVGLKSVRIYPRCAHGTTPNWFSNGTTLAEMGSLFELVDEKRVFHDNWSTTRDTFYGLVLSYLPVVFRDVVTEEAAKLGKSAAVVAFLADTHLDGKPGSYIEYQAGRARTIGRSFSYRVTFPVRVPVGGGAGSVTEPVAHVGGFFVNNLYTPCLESGETSPSGPTPACRKFEQDIESAFWKVVTEAQRPAIREALETW